MATTAPDARLRGGAAAWCTRNAVNLLISVGRTYARRPTPVNSQSGPNREATSGRDPARTGYTRDPITVVLVDREQLVCSAMFQTLSAGGLQVIGAAGNGEDAIATVTQLHPDVVVIGLELPGLSGVQTIGELSQLAPATRVLVLTHSEDQVVEAIVAGASGYILNNAAPDAILAAVRATAAGESVLSPKIAGKLLQRIRERDVPVTAASHAAAHAIRTLLTPRELEIFEHLASGESNQQIGRALSLSTNTVHNHVASILAKLHLENRIQAAVQAVRTGIA